MKTAMQKLMDKVQSINERYELKEDANWLMNEIIDLIENSFETEKENIQKAFSDGQETPINHPNLPHYSRDEYYNDNYNQNK
jgi:hypothetical protein